jgi:phosphoglycolate phosphatase
MRGDPTGLRPAFSIRLHVPDRSQPFLFDLDGTLADTLGDIAASTNHVRAQWHLPPLQEGTVREFIGHGARALLQRSLAELQRPASDSLWDEAYECYAHHHLSQCTKTTRLYPGVREHLHYLQQNSHPLAIVTNKPERFALAVVRHLGLDKVIEVVIGGDTLPQRKPDGAPLRAALRRMGCAEGAHGTMVGDSETDLLAGRAAGLRTIACIFGYRPEAVLRAVGADLFWRAFGVAAETFPGN